MKTIVALGALAVLFAGPALAQAPAKPAEDVTRPEPPSPKEARADAPLDELMLDASTPEERRMLLMRCVGPPPPAFPAELASEASEPAG